MKVLIKTSYQDTRPQSGGSNFMEDYVAKLRVEHPDVEFVEAYSPEIIDKHIGDAEVVFGGVSSDQFKVARSLKWIQTSGAGVEGVLRRLPEIVESDVILTNGRGAGAPFIGEHAVAMMFAFARHFMRFDQDRRDRRWDMAGGLEVVETLIGKTVGILGFGKSGKEVGWRCKALGMRVLAIDAQAIDGEPVIEDVWPLYRLPELLKESDYVVVTVPYTPESIGMIGERELQMMKPTARIIVTSRGGIVDQNALIKALKEGTIAGAGLDTVRPEPLPPEDPLWDAPNLILSPHLAGNAEIPLLYDRAFAIFAENLRRYRSDYPMINVVGKRRGY